MSQHDDEPPVDEELAPHERRLIDAALAAMGVHGSPSFEQFAEACRLLGQIETALGDPTRTLRRLEH